MAAPDAAPPESERNRDNKHPTQNRKLSEHDDDNITVHATKVHVLIKAEDDVPSPATPRTETSLRSNPAPSNKRRESVAAETLHVSDQGERPSKRRKRGASPPWQFPSVDGGTATTADGRRISTRVNTATGTPVVSESEGGRARSISQSQSASRSRPVSPPWKKFGAEGPSSLQVDGKRKSGRMNKELPQVPTRVSPRSKKTVD